MSFVEVVHLSARGIPHHRVIFGTESQLNFNVALALFSFLFGYFSACVHQQPLVPPILEVYLNSYDDKYEKLCQIDV